MQNMTRIPIYWLQRLSAETQSPILGSLHQTENPVANQVFLSSLIIKDIIVWFFHKFHQTFFKVSLVQVGKKYGDLFAKLRLDLRIYKIGGDADTNTLSPAAHFHQA